MGNPSPPNKKKTNKHIQGINQCIISINSHSNYESNSIIIAGYSCYMKNSFKEINYGLAILIKRNIQHRINEYIITDCLEVIIETSAGKLSIASIYLPPRRLFLSYPYVH